MNASLNVTQSGIFLKKKQCLKLKITKIVDGRYKQSNKNVDIIFSLKPVLAFRSWHAFELNRLRYQGLNNFIFFAKEF